MALAAFSEEQGGIKGLLGAIASAAETDEQISQGKALSEREEAVLRALEIMTRGQSGTLWVKAAALREQVTRLHLLDGAGRKRGMDGMSCVVEPLDVLDMIRLYDVAVVHETRFRGEAAGGQSPPAPPRK